MAERMYFVAAGNDRLYQEGRGEFVYNSGFAVCQHRKNIAALHQSIQKTVPDARPFEISRKSEIVLGNQLSAFNLTLKGIPVENIYKSSGVYEEGGPYRDLLHVSPRNAKRDERLGNSGKRLYFLWDGVKYSGRLSYFYDVIYISALCEHRDLLEQVSAYNCFTDIVYNHNKGFSTQARSVAVAVSLFWKYDGDTDAIMAHLDEELLEAYAANGLDRSLFWSERELEENYIFLSH